MRSIIHKRNKKGDAMSILIFLAVAFASIISLIFLTKVFNEVTTAFKNTDMIQGDAKALAQVTKVEGYFVPLIGNGFVFVFFASILGIIVSSFFINTHPGFFIFFLLITIISIVIAGTLANVITEFGTNSALASTYNLYPAVQVIVNNLPLIILVTSAIVAIILFSKTGRNDQLWLKIF